jgi:UDP-N-acetylmuramoylalanine-D-glutamate ligase
MLPFSSYFEGKKSVLLLGFGREGRSSFRFFRKHYPALKLAVADKNPALAEEKWPVDYHLGPDYLKYAADYDVVIKSPGVKVTGIPQEILQRFTSQTDLFLREFGSRITGITGTKGKSTTAGLIHHLLNRSGRKAILMGNIGLPAFDFLEKMKPEDILVYELSAHQLEMVHNSPHRGVLVNIFPEHLDYFGSFEAYKKAKMNIFRFQQPGDMAFCGIGMPGLPDCRRADVLENRFDADRLLQLSGLHGLHNKGNILLAFRVLESFGIDVAGLPAALEGFRPLPHRLEYAGRFGGVDFYNDSISTVPQSTIAAVKSIPGVDTLILGGFDRGLDYQFLVDFLLSSDVRNFFFLGKAGRRMYDLFRTSEIEKNLFPVNDLSEVFETLKRLPEVSCCLLSPAAASYDQFHNFEHRGDRFKALAQRFEK